MINPGRKTAGLLNITGHGNGCVFSRSPDRGGEYTTTPWVTLGGGGVWFYYKKREYQFMNLGEHQPKTPMHDSGGGSQAGEITNETPKAGGKG